MFAAAERSRDERGSMFICQLVPFLDRLFSLLGLYNVPGLEATLVGFLEALYDSAGCNSE